MSKRDEESAQPNEEPEAAELSNDALESVAGGCQIGISVTHTILQLPGDLGKSPYPLPFDGGVELQ